MLLGRRFTLNPVVIFVSLIFWTWLWGVPGALLSVPILVSIKGRLRPRPDAVPSSANFSPVHLDYPNTNAMNPIKFECPYCHEIIAADESLYGQQVKCPKCQATILVPQAPASTAPLTARLIPEPAPTGPILADEATRETDIFNLSPVARAFPGQILLGMMFVVIGVGLALRAHDLSWPRWVALLPLTLGVVLLLVVWIGVKATSYRLTTQRLFVRCGWLGKHVNELELYRVKDVLMDQGAFQRLLGYGTVTVLSADDSTPEVDLARISSPGKIKELIRTEYRAARQREGVHPTEFMQSP